MRQRREICLRFSEKGNALMPAPEDVSEYRKNASYAAYNEALKAAFRTLSDAIAQYFSEHRQLYDDEILDVPDNFRPLKEYERTLRIEELTLRMTLKVAQQNKTTVHTNGHGRTRDGPTLPTQ
jgi:hypothetical protein